jgi:hypothetical protein
MVSMPAVLQHQAQVGNYNSCGIYYGNDRQPGRGVTYKVEGCGRNEGGFSWNSSIMLLITFPRS